jgi:hypothetical protein
MCNKTKLSTRTQVVFVYETCFESIMHMRSERSASVLYVFSFSRLYLVWHISSARYHTLPQYTTSVVLHNNATIFEHANRSLCKRSDSIVHAEHSFIVSFVWGDPEGSDVDWRWCKASDIHAGAQQAKRSNSSVNIRVKGWWTMSTISVFTLIRTDTTLDHSQKAR